MNRSQRREAWLARHRAPPATVRVHVEALVLHGFAPGDRYGIGAAVQQELTRLFAEQGVPAALTRGGETERIDAGSFVLQRGARAGAIGVEVARAVHGGAAR
jgi:hypothetical protein